MQILKFHPGETLVLNFTLPFSVSDIKTVRISFRGRNSLAFEADAVGFKNEDYTDETGKQFFRTRIGYTMNQAETLQFDELSNYMMQLNVYGPNGSRIASKEIEVKTLEQQVYEPGFTSQNFFYVTGSSDSSGQSGISYNDLPNKPRINGVELKGDRTLPEKAITRSEINRILLS